jgi:predicted small metal-binding protein
MKTMKEFSCGDVVPGCVAKFRGQSDEDILQQVASHARHDHGMHEVPSAVVSAVLSHIRDASAA